MAKRTKVAFNYNREKPKKRFKPCGDDIDLVNEQLLNEELEVERVVILKYIYNKYPKIFWEAYGKQF